MKPWLVGLTMAVEGLAISYLWDLPSGPTIVLLGAALLGAVAGGQGMGRRYR